MGSVITDNSDEWNLDQCRKSYEEQSKAILQLQEAMAKQDERISQNTNQTEKLSNQFESFKQLVQARPDIRCKYFFVKLYSHFYCKLLK